jgi:hypothetical protein
MLLYGVIIQENNFVILHKYKSKVTLILIILFIGIVNINDNE